MQPFSTKRCVVRKKTPLGIALTALYLACQENGESVTQKKITEAAGVHSKTITIRAKEFKK